MDDYRLKTKLVSDEHFNKEMRQFSSLKRKIRRWLNDKTTTTLDINNTFHGIQMIFSNEFILELAKTRFQIDERKVLFALMRKFDFESEDTDVYNKVFYNKLLTDTFRG